MEGKRFPRLLEKGNLPLRMIIDDYTDWHSYIQFTVVSINSILLSSICVVLPYHTSPVCSEKQQASTNKG